MNRAFPDDAMAQLDAARAAHKQGRFAEARRSYRRLLKKYPALTPALHYLGVLEHMTGDSEKGLRRVQQAFARAPEDYDIRKNLGNILTDMNRSEEAETIYRGLIAERPLDSGNHSNHCIALRKLERFDEAIAAGRRGVELASDHPAGWHAYANALGSAGRLAEAVTAYERVLQLEPRFSPAHNSLCQVMLRLEQRGWLSRRRFARTRAAYRRWLDAVPDHPTARFMLEALERGSTPDRMPDNVVRDSFDAYAEHFDRHLKSLDYQGPELIDTVLARRLPGPDGSLDVLDGGCGTGLAGRMLRPYARTLIGVDLSSAMLDRARATGLYDELIEAELGAFLHAEVERFDLCTLVDVLVYFGDLTGVLSDAGRALRVGGLIAFSVERSTRPGRHLHPSGRYRHHRDHVEAALLSAGFRSIEQVEDVVRKEGEVPVQSLIVSAEFRPGV